MKSANEVVRSSARILINSAVKAGANSVMLYDATMCISPEGMRYYTRSILKNLVKEVPLIVARAHFEGGCRSSPRQACSVSSS
jgi:hypothetical protein